MDAITHRNGYDRQLVIDALKRIDGPATVAEIAREISLGMGTWTVSSVLPDLIDEKRVRQVRQGGNDRYELVPPPPPAPTFSSPF